MIKKIQNSIFIALIFLGSYKVNSQVLPQDSLALVDLYNATNGGSWNDNTNWLSGAPVSDWAGITVVGDRVKDVRLFSNNLTGSIPTSIGDLTEMRLLHLSDNNLSGSIPAEMANCKFLIRLYLDRNDLVGGVPAFLGSLNILREIWMNDNNFTGSIPAQVFQNANLRIISLSNNDLDGTIPSMSALINLQKLYLQNNLLTGFIPSDLTSATSLLEIYLDGNMLEGSIPSGIANLTNLQAFGAANNMLTGSVPDFGQINTMQWLILGGNRLSGFDGMTSTPNYEYCGVQNNSLNFMDLEPVYANSPASFDYLNQDSIDLSASYLLNQGDVITFSVSDLASSNNYQWTRNGVDIDGATNSSYSINGATIGDIGAYSCKITNSVVTGLTINRRPINVDVVAASDCHIYRLDNKVLPPSGETFYLKFWAKSVVPSGIIGLDLCLNYDPSEVIPTGNTVNGIVLSGGNSAHVGKRFSPNNAVGEANLSLYYNTNAPLSKQLSGSGAIVWVEFQSQTNSGLPSTVSICGLDEGYETSVTSYCREELRPEFTEVKEGTNSQDNQQFNNFGPLSLEGRLRFWGINESTRQLSYLSTNPNYYRPTDIGLTCSPDDIIRPDKYGRFFLDFTNESHLSIDRDVRGDYFNNSNCTDISKWINAYDIANTAQIVTKSPNFTPNVYQIISSDVNLDGVIRSNDLTLMCRRSSGLICEFPQAWNYSNGVSNGDLSLDWLFFDEDKLISDSDYTIDNSYPNSSGVGFSRDLVPLLDNCIERPNTENPNAVVFYHAVLLGSSQGNWTKSSGTKLRTSSTNSFEDEILSGDLVMVNMPTRHIQI